MQAIALLAASHNWFVKSRIVFPAQEFPQLADGKAKIIFAPPDWAFGPCSPTDYPAPQPVECKGREFRDSPETPGQFATSIQR